MNVERSTGNYFMNSKKLQVGIVGCGYVAGPYARDLVTHPEIELVGVTDLDMERAQRLAGAHGCRVYPTLTDLLSDAEIDLVVNLTTHHAHKDVTEQCLRAGKHVHSEKPLALTVKSAHELVELARERGVRLAGTPFTWMGEAQQTAGKVIREGRLGKVRVVYAEANWGRLETWHPAPEPFYEVGALFDVGVYPLAIVTAFFGPARRVHSYGTVLQPQRVRGDGSPLHVETPDFMATMLELENGAVVRLTTNFYVTQRGKQGGIEFHGDAGSLYLSSWHMFNAAVEFAEFGQPYVPVPLLREPYPGLEWGRSIVELAEAVAANRPHRASGEHAAHLVEIVCAAHESLRLGQPVSVHSHFPPPMPMEWAM
ncbi:MAG: Gfo/Idh/MocA family protein [Ardenticatenaceae bacterium]